MYAKHGNLGNNEKPTRNCLLLYNNVAFSVGNFGRKVWASKISRTPLSFGDRYLGNPWDIVGFSDHDPPLFHPNFGGVPVAPDRLWWNLPEHKP